MARLFSSGWIGLRVQRRLALLAAVLMVGLSLVFLALLISTYRGQLLADYARASLQINQLFQATLENAMLKRDLDGLQEILERLGAQEGVEQVQIVNREGEVRFSSRADTVLSQLDDPDFAAALASRAHQTGFRDLAGGGRVLRSINPVPNRDACIDCHGPAADFPVNGLLVVDYRADALQSSLWRGTALLTGLGAVMLATVIGGLWIGLRRIVLDRIDALDGAAQKLAAGDLSARCDLTGRDELARLGRNFNAMAGRMQGVIAALAASETFLQALIDAAPDGIRVIGPDYRVLMANRAYLAQTGRKAVGALCHASSHDRDTPCPPGMVCCPHFELLEKDGKGVTCRHTHLDPAGGPRHVEVAAVRAELVIDDAPTPVVVESIRDLDAQVQVSQQERLSELGVLAAGVAHEVQNPLASIQLVLDALESRDLDAEAKEYIGIARKEIAACQTATESLLRLVAPSAPGLARASELLDLGEIVADTARLLAFEAERAAVDISLARDGDLALFGDESDLRMLVFNLSLNAIHAMPTGGSLDISVAREGGDVVLSVADRGVGIAERDRERVMTPFWTRRADGSRGRGLGLTICKGVVDGMGGDIGFAPRTGGGTVFRARMPAAFPARAAEPAT